jgi:hypothetical protein
MTLELDRGGDGTIDESYEIADENWPARALACPHPPEKTPCVCPPS